MNSNSQFEDDFGFSLGNSQNVDSFVLRMSEEGQLTGPPAAFSHNQEFLPEQGFPELQYNQQQFQGPSINQQFQGPSNQQQFQGQSINQQFQGSSINQQFQGQSINQQQFPTYPVPSNNNYFNNTMVDNSMTENHHPMAPRGPQLQPNTRLYSNQGSVTLREPLNVVPTPVASQRRNSLVSAIESESGM
jgi:hypothetical protein